MTETVKIVELVNLTEVANKNGKTETIKVSENINITEAKNMTVD